MSKHELIGAIVEDQSVDFRPRYAVGAKGFLSLSDGTWLPYDSAFNGLEFFRDPAFVVVDLPADRAPERGQA